MDQWIKQKIFQVDSLFWGTKWTKQELLHSDQMRRTEECSSWNYNSDKAKKELEEMEELGKELEELEELEELGKLEELEEFISAARQVMSL